jgi:hypothetical protein
MNVGDWVEFDEIVVPERTPDRQQTGHASAGAQEARHGDRRTHGVRGGARQATFLVEWTPRVAGGGGDGACLPRRESKHAPRQAAALPAREDDTTPGRLGRVRHSGCQRSLAQR